MSFKKAGQQVKPRRVKKSLAHKRFGRVKTIQVPMEAHERKVSVCYSLPSWMIGWIEGQARERGMHKSTFLAACVESTRAGMAAVEEAQARRDEMSEEGEEEED